MTQSNNKDALVSGGGNLPLSLPAHVLSQDRVVDEIQTNRKLGLKDDEAEKRLTVYGRNELESGGGVQPFRILIRQIANAMILVLILAMAASLGIKSWIEGGVIAAVVILNIVVGFFQEFKAEKTLDSLRSLSSPTANAVRSGRNKTIPTSKIVPGDLVEMRTGDTVPADVRLFEAINFELDEALLTGESLPVRKQCEALSDLATGAGDRLNIAFSSSTVTKGRAHGIVFATGMHTEVGSIAAALRKKNSKVRSVKRKPDGSASPPRYIQAWSLTASDAVGHFLGVNVGTPLQKKLSRLAVLLFCIAVVCAIIVLGANQFSNEQAVIIYAVATGLSMIPASLIVVLTITMAAGTKRMVERHVVVRNLKSLEALGAVTDICSDKTGTLTQGKMIVRKAWVSGKGTYTIYPSSEPFNPTTGEIDFEVSAPKQSEAKEPSLEKMPAKSAIELLKENGLLEKYLTIASLANLATIQEADGSWHARGDPTEIAIQVFASRFDRNRLSLTEQESPQWQVIEEFSFDSEVKKMSVICQNNTTQQKHILTKGAVERVVDSCTSLCDSEGSRNMTDDDRRDILANMEALAGLGLRVLAFASKSLDQHIESDSNADRDKFENDLSFSGLVGLYDPPRPESAPSVKRCHQAGISVHMLTGDHPGTARAIAHEVDILPKRMDHISRDVIDAMVMTAGQFDKHSDEEIDSLPTLPLVIARCTPHTKVRMIEALHRRKRFVAMTGDGVNDSPSLKQADVGIAMGEAGSDVAKDASDIVLTDDNFASILNAIEEGRRMFDNIQKFVLHLLAENIAQASTLLIGLVFKDSSGISVFPLAPVEILWVIMITSGMPDMGLGFEAAAPDILQRLPQSLKRGVFTVEVMIDMLVYGVWTASLCLSSFILVLYGFGDGELGEGCNDAYSESCNTVFRARATCFACLTWFALFLAWEMVNMRRSFFRMQPKSKRYFTQWMFDVWRNKFLFFAILTGFVTIFPTLYVPVINQVVFKHTGISWEWGIVFVEALLFFGGIESWKWAKRIYFRRQIKKATGDDGVEGGTNVDDVEKSGQES